MQPFTERVIRIIKGIPEGQIMTYGQVAAAAGSPRGARQVVRILHSLSVAHQLPWHRIVNAKGEIALQEDAIRIEQITRLEGEGVELDRHGKIDLEAYQYVPEPLL
ncbi:MGMT family protein [Paenibacillus sp. NEAU-GSW1]|uniref:MGMT family protein n=1 Tax=Paenibacillus sp. NEAU-GSW1 TaxID=2682486 RepID=UPI0012E1BBBE|nr:MGMT family protein [Paenibacillus sp. NEAU-GSW1]MUT68010.1 DNA methyltransferase [Paenibacillus sp. NEAU-GSW1]